MSQNQRVALQLSGGAGCSYSAWPVTQGIPFADGVLRRGVPVRVVDENGRPLPTQAKCLATWNKDLKFVKWLLVDFQADLLAGQTRQFFLEYGPDAVSPAHSSPILIRREPAHIHIANDSMRLTLRNNLRPSSLFNDRDFFSSCVIHTADGWRESFRGKPGPYLYMKDQYENEYTSGGPGPGPQITIEDDGPLRASVCIRGHHADRQGRKFCPFILRFHVFAGKSDIKLYHTFIFDQDPHAVELTACGLKWPLNLGDFLPSPQTQAVNPRASGSALRLAIGGENNAHWANNGLPLQLLQNNDCCYGVTLGAQAFGNGARSAGWATLQGTGGTALAAIKDHWQEYPKGLALDQEGMDIQIWPEACRQTLKFTTPFEEPAILFNRTRDEAEVKRLLAENPTAPLNLKSFGVESPAILLWVEEMMEKHAVGRAITYNDTGIENGMGAAKTTELWLRLSPAAITDDEAGAFAGAVQEPLIAPAEPAHVCATRAAGHAYHANDPRFAEVDAGLDDTLRMVAIEPVEKCRLYGMMRYGNMVCSHAPGPALAYIHYKDSDPAKALRWVGPYNNEANDQIGAVWGNFVRTGRRDHYFLAQRYSRNVADVGFIHAHPSQPRLEGLMHYHNCHQWSGGGSPSHSLVRGLLLDYYFTGNRRLLDVALENAEWTIRQQTPAGIIHCNDSLHREFTGPLWNLLEVYQATWQEKYGDLARRSLNWFLRTLPEPGNYPVGVYTCGERGDEAVVGVPAGITGNAREIYYLLEAAQRLFPSQALRAHIMAEADHYVWDELFNNFVTPEMARRFLSPRSNLWPVDDGFYWTQWATHGAFMAGSGLVCVAYDWTGDPVYAAYAKEVVTRSFAIQAALTRRFVDFRFTWLAFGNIVPALLSIVARAMDRDPEGLARAEQEWRRRRADKGLPVYAGPGVNLARDTMDVNGNISNRPPVDLPRETPPPPRGPNNNLGILSTEDHRA